MMPGYNPGMIISFGLFCAGLLLVIGGANFLVDGASSLAKRFAVPEIVIGLTIVAFGTSAPELVVNIIASTRKIDDVTLGNIIGSNIFNILFILGAAGLITPINVLRNTVLKEIPFALATTFVFFILANDRPIFNSQVDSISRLDSLILLILFGIFLIYILGIAKIKPDDSAEVKVFSILKSWILIIPGFIGLFLGGKLIVDHAVIIARTLHVSEKLIALTIVAAGTSIPELATSAVAAYKKRYDLSVGNIVGSNIFNLLLITGISGMVHPIAFSTGFNIDIMVMSSATLFLLLAMFTGKKGKLDRWEAAGFLFIYSAYIFYLLQKK